MEVKIDTKEILHVITIEERKLAAIMTEEVKKSLLFYIDQPIKNVVINFSNVDEIEQPVAITLLNIQQAFYDASSSMVFCNIKPGVEKFFEEQGILEDLNVTPTVSEACDIVQMEEIEREFL
jgi:anti-anti-sigma regulatory factor